MVFDKKEYDRQYRSQHSEGHKVYAKNYYRANKDRLHQLSEAKRVSRRHKIQELWGRVGGAKGTWKNLRWVDSEKVAIGILGVEGFKNVKRLDYFKHCPFDVVGEDINQEGSGRTVFQITMRTHQDSYVKHLKLAEDLGLRWLILYIRPQLDRYIIKSPYESGCYELNLADMKRLKEVVP